MKLTIVNPAVFVQRSEIASTVVFASAQLFRLVPRAVLITLTVFLSLTGMNSSGLFAQSGGAAITIPVPGPGGAASITASGTASEIRTGYALLTSPGPMASTTAILSNSVNGAVISEAAV